MKENPKYKLAGRHWKNNKTVVDVHDCQIGGDEIFMIAGPCAVESEEQIDEIAQFVIGLGVKFLRGGAFKPRTSPYSFQGLEVEGLKLLNGVSKKYNLGIITEVLDLSLLDTVYPYADILQVGARNMKNYHFLKELGKTDKPIMLKRGMDATVEEWLLAAEYILLGGNENVILCERGIRTFDDSNRNTMDIAAIALAAQLTHLPIIADPSQGTGNRNLIGAMSKAAVAAGADGLMIEVHNNPKTALSDGPQSLYLEQFAEMLPEIEKVASAIGKTCSWRVNSEVINAEF
ncbi:MAG: 3-deoxy-7-phosphoheptulonate synthase [Flavobacteriales bacterium]|nr:3-deoxy-7-phosphoheptulonate synthase [Flavobacteriales bacterium]